ncbi:rhodanese-like domain-containing protein [Kordiimonas pumila]|uniref:Rhodanese-like domain-containing protein n=1 Tax=Kordiimonas pumila TaxID=2161677 RepID=A0ABV7D1C8_9PROT|nr:rhodanese-like domain-containing protein [Kordiimonas pumila]
MSDVKFISADAFAAILKNDPNCCMIDVRTAAEHAACHVAGVELLPLQNFDAESVASSLKARAPNKPVYVLCKGGGRAKQAAEQLAAKVSSDIYVVEGGTDACSTIAGVPVNRGASNHMSLERQVRIAAGSFVVLGILLSILVNPAFVWFSAFVGAGLVFAGLTDTCAMGMLIARMPWNKV